MSNINIPTLQDFIALSRGGFARADRFVVNFTTPPAIVGNKQFSDLIARDFSMLCEEAAFPGKTINTRTLRINGLNEQRAHTVDYMGDSINLQFIVDINWRVRSFFEKWMALCVGGEENTTLSREVGFYSDYISTISINALVQRYNGPTTQSPSSFLDKIRGRKIQTPNEDPAPEESTFQLELHEAWPRAMNVQQVSYGNQQFHRLNMTFTYKYYKTIYNTVELESLPLAKIDPLEQAINTGREQVVSAGKGLSGLLQNRRVNIIK